MADEGKVDVQHKAFSVDGGQAEVKADAPFWRRHRCAFICCVVFIIIVVILALVVTILALTVFKQRKPRISVHSVTLEDFDVNWDPLNFITPPSINLTLSLDISVKNPNYASFKYYNSTSFLYYHGTQVGEAPIPAGRIGARGTETLTIVLTLMADRLLSNLRLLISDLFSGSFPVYTSANISGRVNLFNIVKIHADASTVCNMTLSITSRSLGEPKCTYHVDI